MHLHPSTEGCSGICAEWEQWSDSGCHGEACYLVNLESGVCDGRITGDIVQVSPEWWKTHCARVGAHVKKHSAGVAQLVERELPKLEVAGSNPVSRSKIPSLDINDISDISEGLRLLYKQTLEREQDVTCCWGDANLRSTHLLKLCQKFQKIWFEWAKTE